MTDPFTTHRTRPLRRAISLEDLSSAASIHRQLHSSGLLHQSRLRPISNTHSPRVTPSPTEIATLQSARHTDSVLSIQPPNSRSAASSASAITRTIEHMEFVPLKDKPQFNHDQEEDQEEEEEELEPHLLDRDRRDATNLPTPDVSPEELSDSSEDLVDQGELTDPRSMSFDGAHRQRRHDAYPGPGVAPQGDEDSSSWNWLKDSPFLDALVNWIEGPDAVAQPKGQEKDKPNPWLDIPFQFIALLTYPEPDAKTGNKMTLARNVHLPIDVIVVLVHDCQVRTDINLTPLFFLSTIVVRETAFVRQRRRTLFMLTVYTLLVRYCSFDFFLVVLFASNCAMLFLMKNSGRMNVNMAKRAVRQRVGWAKQWAGSIFKRGNNISTNNINVPGMPPPHSRPSSTHRRGASQATLTLNTAQSESLRNMQTSTEANASSLTIAPETSPQMKRRGLFGKKVAVGGHSHSASTSTVQGSILINDGASVMTATATTAPSTKRRFFRRNQNNSINNTSTMIPNNTSVPIPIPAPKQSPSILSPTPKTIIPSAPLSSSPLTQSQSLPQLQFSPKKPVSPAPLSTAGTTLGDHEVHCGKKTPSPRSFERSHELQLNTKLPMELASHLATPSPSTPPLFSGLSQLLNRSSSPSVSSSSRPSQPSPTLHQPEIIDYGDQGILLDVETELDKIFSGAQKQYAASLSSSSSQDIKVSGNVSTSEKPKESMIPIV